MSYDPREHFQQIQRTLQQRTGRGFGGVPGGGAAGRGILALIGVGVAGVIISNSIFNGALGFSRRWIFSSDKKQLTAVIVRSSTKGYLASRKKSTMKACKHFSDDSPRH